MVDTIIADRPHLPRTVEAIREIPRLGFFRAIDPDVTATDAYDPNLAVVTQTDPDTGAVLSCSSVPTLVATMLDQADVQPGDRVLEVGSATGINAAYLSYLAGPTGHVTTMDIDEWVTAGTRQALDANGYQHVQVITRDGARGHADGAPYDKIVVTVGAWDLAAAWWQQLAPGGRMVVPLRWRGQTRCLALVRDGDHLRSESVELCGFVPMIGQDGEKSGAINTDATVIIHWDQDQPVDPVELVGTLDQARIDVWTDTTIVSGESFDGIWLRLSGAEPGTCRIEVNPEAVQAGVCTPAIAARSAAIVEGDSLAYFILRVQDEAPVRQWVLGAAGHGRHGERLAQRLCAQIRAWDGDREEVPSIIAYPAGRFAVHQLGQVVVVRKPESDLTVTFAAA
jgi:protein-L-isoaspartate(D-aspartate) O-methyltransferase